MNHSPTIWPHLIPARSNNTDHHRVREAFDRSLAALDIEYIDLYLMHWPQASVDGARRGPTESPTPHETWAAMVPLLATGKVRALGVSNFGAPLLAALVEREQTREGGLVPAVNQVELHPCLPQAALRRVCAEHGVTLTAYSPIGQPVAGQPSPLLTDEALAGVAARKGGAGATPAQVALSWAVQRGIVVVPKSENPERMKQNITVSHSHHPWPMGRIRPFELVFLLLLLLDLGCVFADSRALAAGGA